MFLKAENIYKSFGRNKVLKNVSIEIDRSSFYGIVGENGSGKTTLLKIIVGEWKPDRGKVLYKGKIGYCPQKSLLFSHLTVDEHFRYFATAYGLSRQEYLKRSETLMDFFSFTRFRSLQIHTLSGGTQQKLNLSVALLHQPDILILDEPYSGFDWETYMRFWDYTSQLRSEGCAILIVTHMLTEKERFDRIFSMEQGVLS